MIAPVPSRRDNFTTGDDLDFSPVQTLLVSAEDVAALRRTCFQLALASHDGHVRIARVEGLPDLTAHAENVASERRAQCRVLANLTFRDGANIALAGSEARDARSAWVRATQALLCGDIQAFHDQVSAAESLLEDALLQASLTGAGDEAAQFYVDLSLAVHQERQRWSGLCREFASSQLAP